MTWTRLSDTFTEEMEELGAEVMAMHVAALCYCNRLLTDGRIPTRKARTLFPIDDPDLAIKTLIDAGYWTETETGYEIANFLTDQRPAETVLAEREAARIRQANWRAAKSGKANASTTAQSNGSKERNGVTNGVSNAFPAPPRPAPKEGGVGGVLPASGSPGGSPSPSHPRGSEKTRPQQPAWTPTDRISHLGLEWEDAEDNTYDTRLPVAEISFDISVAPACDDEDNDMPGYTHLSIMDNEDHDSSPREFYIAVSVAVLGKYPQSDLYRASKGMCVELGYFSFRVPTGEVDQWIDRVARALNDPDILKLIQPVAGNFSTDTSDQVLPEGSR